VPMVKHVVEKLIRFYQLDEHIAVAIWCENDVIYRAGKTGIPVTREEAREILDRINNKQDCEIGINWDVIDAYIDELKRSPSDAQIPEKPCTDGSIAQ